MSFSFSVGLGSGSGSGFENPVAIVLCKPATNRALEYAIVAIAISRPAPNKVAV